MGRGARAEGAGAGKGRPGRQLCRPRMRRNYSRQIQKLAVALLPAARSGSERRLHEPPQIQFCGGRAAGRIRDAPPNEIRAWINFIKCSAILNVYGTGGIMENSPYGEPARARSCVNPVRTRH